MEKNQKLLPYGILTISWFGFDLFTKLGPAALNVNTPS
jgi:hypothetical protein